LTQREFLALLRGQYLNPSGLGHDDNGQPFSWHSGSRGAQHFPKVPSDEGRKLMESGVFGTSDRREPNRKTLARRILDRELGLCDLPSQKVNQGLMAQVGK
jgi:WD repeat-containing protein 23